MKLYPFQEKAVTESLLFLRKIGAVYNACEMGLGKSLQAIETCNRIGSKKVLVICPATVRFVWAQQLELWGHAGIRFTVFSYNAVTTQAELFKTIDFDTLILDEAHYVKNPKAKRTKAVLKYLWPKAKYKICLSGTPMTSSVADAWTLFSKMHPEFGDYWEFAHRYTKVQRTPWGDKPTGIKRAEELKAIIRENFFVRYLKADVLPELPAKTWQKVPLGAEYAVRLTGQEQLDMQKYIAALKKHFVTGKPMRMAPPKSHSTWHKEQGIKKVPAILAFCKDILEQEIPLVIFTWHKEVLKQLSEGLKAYDPCIIEGATEAKARESAVTRFQNGESNCFIGNLVSAGTGITLTRASICVFAELYWSPDKVSQAVDRLHRIGQRSAVSVFYFSAQGSIDEEIMDVLIDKLSNFIEVIN